METKGARETERLVKREGDDNMANLKSECLSSVMCCD